MADDIQALAARLRRLEDSEEIRALFLRYADCLDANDFAGYANLFASDGELLAQLGTAKGPAAIRALLEERLGTDIAKARAVSFHVISNPVIEVDGDRATARVLWSYLTQRAEACRILDPHPGRALHRRPAARARPLEDRAPRDHPRPGLLATRTPEARRGIRTWGATA